MCEATDLTYKQRLWCQEGESDALQLEDAKACWSTGLAKCNVLDLKSCQRTTQMLEQASL